MSALDEPIKPRRWITTAEASQQIGINESTLYRLCRKGKIAHYRIGARAGKIRFTQANIDDYLIAAAVPIRPADQEELKPGIQIPSKWFPTLAQKRRA